MTDDSAVYPEIGHEFGGHGSVNHSAGEYVRGDVTTNQAENFFSQLKRSIDGTHHRLKVSPTPLGRFESLPLR